MKKEKVIEIANEMMNELYQNSKPKITRKEYKKKYGKTAIAGYERHQIDKKKSEEILEKYKKKVRQRYHFPLDMFWLDFCPKGSE